jgi:aromatic ring-opening dioxygenase catalytic subunit (LigB family)
MNDSTRRMPVAFISHGAGPWPLLDIGFPINEGASLLAHLRDVARLSATMPAALVVISAHWEEPAPTVMSSASPPILYDYGGFPPIAFPDAQIPVVQLSLIKGLDAGKHLKMGQALAPLRDEGVLILGTGNTFHNLQVFRAAMQGSAPGAEERAAAFDDWLQAAVTAEPAVRDEQLQSWEKAPSARFAQPREDHLIPLMVAAGAAGADRGVTMWSGTLAGLRGSSFRFG